MHESVLQMHVHPRKHPHKHLPVHKNKNHNTAKSTCTNKKQKHIYIYNTAYRSSKNLSKIISSQMGSTFIWFEAFPVLPKATEPLSLGVSCKRPSQWHPRARSTMATAVDFYQTRSSLRHHHLPFMFEVFKVWWISSGDHLAVQHPTSYKVPSWCFCFFLYFPLFPHRFLP